MEWDETLNRFRTFQQSAGLGHRTIESREAVLRALASHSAQTPARLAFDHLTAFLTRPHAYTGAALAPGTKQVERSYLQVWSKWALAENIISTDIATRLPRVKVPRRRGRPVVQAHVEAMLKIDSLWQTTLDMIAIAVNIGLRVNEIVSIHGHDYDPHSQRLRIVRKGGFIQYVRCNRAVVEIAERLPADGWWFASPYPNKLFPEGGGHILPKSASARMIVTMRRVGIKDPRLTGHSLRHFYCCLQLRIGTPIHVVQELMGHASLATTQMYIQVTDEEVNTAAALTPYIPAPLSTAVNNPTGTSRWHPIRTTREVTPQKAKRVKV